MIGGDCPVCGEFFTSSLSEHLKNECGAEPEVEEPEPQTCEICGEAGANVMPRQVNGRKQTVCRSCADSAGSLKGQRRAGQPPTRPAGFRRGEDTEVADQ